MHFFLPTKLEYHAGLKEESPSELLRFTIRHHILNQVHNHPEYLVLKQEQQQQQQLHSQVILPSITTAVLNAVISLSNLV
jgi:hypothetical protein